MKKMGDTRKPAEESQDAKQMDRARRNVRAVGYLLLLNSAVCAVIGGVLLAEGLIEGALWMGVFILLLVTAIGLWCFAEWARVLTLALIAISVAVGVFAVPAAICNGAPAHMFIVWLVNVAIWLYIAKVLTEADVRAAFRQRDDGCSR